MSTATVWLMCPIITERLQFIAHTAVHGFTALRDGGGDLEISAPHAPRGPESIL
jgi:hypothetical protein